MPELRLPGLNTGIDTGALVQQLMEIERRRLRTYETKVQESEQKKGAVSELNSVLSSFKSKAQALSDSSQLKSFETTSSDSDIISATANSNAIEGSHSVQVKQLATTERWVHDGYKYESSKVGAGNFIFSYNNEELVITTDANTTLEDLVGLINNDPDNPGVDASILKYDNGSDGIYHLVLSGRESGSDYQVTINTENTEVWKADTELLYNGSNASEDIKLRELDLYDTLGPFDSILISGTDHDGNAVSSSFTVDDDTTIGHLIDGINDAYDGAAVAKYSDGIIKITDTTTGASLTTLSLEAYDGVTNQGDLAAFTQFTQGGSTAANIASLDQSTFLETQSAQDSLLRVDDYPPFAAQITTTAASTSGSYTLTYEGETTGAIAHDADAATIQAALEALSNVNAGDITVVGDGLNTAGTLTIQFNTQQGSGDLITFNTGTLDGTHAKTEQGWISRSTNTVDDVIQGVTLKLNNLTYDKTTDEYDKIDVTLTRDTEDLKGNVQALVDEYNKIVDFFNNNADYDAETETVGLLYGEYSLTVIEQILRSPFSSTTTGFTDADSFIMPEDIGIEVQNDGTVKLDGSKFDEAINENYADVLKLLGAKKAGSSSSDSIKFYYASETLTDPGVYEVSVLGDGSAVTSAKIRLQGETEWRDMTISVDGGTYYIDGSGDDNPENSLSLTVDATKTSGTPLTATISIKQGFAGELEEAVEDMLDSDTGRVPILRDSITDKIDRLTDQIFDEESRLEDVEQRLVMKYARLERNLSLIQQQFAGLM